MLDQTKPPPTQLPLPTNIKMEGLGKWVPGLCLCVFIYVARGFKTAFH